jgi:quercetin dioxygenase-like cupin family protein
MPTITRVDEREWIHEDVVGHAIDRCKLWYDGHGVSFSIVKMPANYQLSLHRHETWVSVFVLEGSMLVQAKGDDEQKVTAGGFYFVRPGEEHIETSIDETQVLIVKAEPNIQYQVDSEGNTK